MGQERVLRPAKHEVNCDIHRELRTDRPSVAAKRMHRQRSQGPPKSQEEDPDGSELGSKKFVSKESHIDGDLQGLATNVYETSNRNLRRRNGIWWTEIRKEGIELVQKRCLRIIAEETS